MLVKRDSIFQVEIWLLVYVAGHRCEYMSYGRSVIKSEAFEADPNLSQSSSSIRIEGTLRRRVPTTMKTRSRITFGLPPNT